MSFFDEDDEPRSRVRPRRSASSRSGSSPDRQTVLVRQLLLFAGFILVLALLIFVIDGCRDSARENGLKDYNRDVASIVRDSDSQVGKPFFDLMRNPGNAGDLSTQIAGYKVQAEQQYQQARRVSTPGDLTAAQRSFLMTMEMRRDGLQSIADRIRTALSSDAEAADEAITQIAGAMQLFLSSDVIYATRVLPFIEAELREADVGAQRLQRTQFLPGVEWLDPTTVADTLGAELSGGGGSGRDPAPGLHGTGIDSVQVGDLTLEPGAPNRIPYGPDTEFTVNFTNQGDNDEVDVVVVLRIEGGPEPLRVQKKVASVPQGTAAAATLSLDTPPPLDTPVTIVVQVKPVPGEENRDNNTAEYDAAFSQE